MAKLTLDDVANLQNENSATATINSNSAATETALEKTLSRDGTAPNQMEANFDMNSYRILNLPKAVNADEPLRLQDLSDFYSTGTVSNIPAGGNQGDVLAKTSATDYAFDWVSDVSLLSAGDNIVLSGTSPVTVGTSLTPTFTTVNGITLTASTGTFTLANSKVLTVSNTLTFTGTDGSTAAFGVGGTVAYKGLSLAQFASTTSAELSALLSDETGTGSAVFSNSPTLVTPALGTPSAVVLTNGTGLPISTGVSGLGTGIAAFLATPSSANLRTALTDETGTGAAYFVGGDLGTPSAGVATNLTGTASGLTAGNVTTNANLTGDVTSVGNATTIAANAVTNAKLATAADSTIKSNISGATAVPSDNTITAVFDKQFGSAQGSVAYRGASSWEALSPGTTGYFLKTQGAAANPVWASVPGGGDLLSTNNLSDVADPSTARNNLGIIPALRNALINGAMDIWQRGTSVSCSAGSRTFLADRWFVNPAGAAVTASRTSAVLPTNARSRYNLQITGAASVTTVNVGQRIEAANVLQIKGTVVFQAQIYNGTGAAFTPSLLIGTPAAADDFTTVTNRLTQVLQSCANGAYTQVSYSVDISGYTNIDNGLQVELQFPSGLLVAAKDVKITEVSLQLGTQPTTFERLPLTLIYNLCLPYYQKSFAYATTPAQNLGVFFGAVVTVTASTTAGSGAESVKFLPPMRTTPTITTYNTNAANANWWDSTAGTSRTAATADASEKGFRATVNATTTAAAQHFIQWSADAEL